MKPAVSPDDPQDLSVDDDPPHGKDDIKEKAQWGSVKQFDEDVINFALDKLPPEEVQSHYQAWQKEAWKQLSQKSKPLKRSRSEAKK